VLHFANKIEDEGGDWPDTDTIGAEGRHYQLRTTWRLRSRPSIRRCVMTRELDPRDVLADLFGSGDFPAEILAPEAAAEIVVQRLIDAGFQIKPAERCAS
jgi:hypothetical protein